MKSAREQRIAELTATTAHLERQIAALKGDVGMELDEAACAYQKQHPDVSYSDALQAAMRESPNLAAEYIASFGTAKLSPEQVKTYGLEDDEEAAGKGSEAAGKEIDVLVKKWLAEKGLDDDSYTKGLGHVLQAHPELGKKWMGR